jgi:hypothetical protein
VHPTEGHGGAPAIEQHHELTLVSDNLKGTVEELKAKGAEFTRDIRDDGWGLTTSLKVPGAGELMVYEPRHPTAYDV